MDECDGKYARPMVTRTYNSSFCMYDDHLYPGGARRLHMLRHLLGDKVFWPAITEYLTRYAGKVVDTEDFRKVLEERSSLNLQWWFDQWIYGKGYPKLKGDFKWNPNTSEVAISLRQTQVDKAGGVPLFFLDVPIHVIDSKGITHMGKASFRVGAS
jgi:aminopeptidase N